MTEAVKEVIWLRGLLGELISDQEVITVYCDSRSAIHLTKNQMYHERIKHIDVRHIFVQDIVDKSDLIFVEKIGTAGNATYMLTKHLLVAKFKHCLKSIGMGHT